MRGQRFAYTSTTSVVASQAFANQTPLRVTNSVQAGFRKSTRSYQDTAECLVKHRRFNINACYLPKEPKMPNSY